MRPEYNPRNFRRLVSAPLLREYFDQRPQLQELDWDGLADGDAKGRADQAVPSVMSRQDKDMSGNICSDTCDSLFLRFVSPSILPSHFLLFFPSPHNWLTARVPAHVAHYARVGVFRLSPLRGVVPLGGPIGRVPKLTWRGFSRGAPEKRVLVNGVAMVVQPQVGRSATALR
jgi:hypothetical protein